MVAKRQQRTKLESPAVTVQYWENKGPLRLSSILEWCLREHQVDTLLVTAVPSAGRKGGYSFSPEVDRAAREILQENLLKRFRATGWPGTKLFESSGRVYVARFDGALLRRLVEREDDLFGWTYWPNRLPEDICVFRSGSRFPLFFSVTHEKDASVLEDKGLKPPGFIKSTLPLNKYVWNGPYFCRTEKRRR